MSTFRSAFSRTFARTMSADSGFASTATYFASGAAAAPCTV
nr:hypothetical protein [Fodinicola feengrottensis]